jgi:PAS domain S-box-containing protein
MWLLKAFYRSGDGAYAVDFNQRIVYWNRKAERLLGYPASEVLGRHCYDLIAGGDHAGHPFCGSDCPVIECARRGRAAENYDVCTRTASGQRRWINVSIVVLKGRSVRSTITVHLFRFVSARWRTEMQGHRALPQLTPGSSTNALRSGSRLTRRESEVLQLLATGLSTPRIADILGVSRATVRNHVERLLAKLGVHSRVEAVAYAAQRDLV